VHKSKCLSDLIISSTGHGSALSVAVPAAGTVFTVRTNHLPMVDLIWVSPTCILGVGHDCSPLLFGLVDNQWQFLDKLDSGEKKSTAAAGSAMNKFKQMDSRGQNSDSGSASTELTTTHQNTIT
jgi:actin related protein 2/3 complex subunit 1A/1B